MCQLIVAKRSLGDSALVMKSAGALKRFANGML